MNHKLTAAQAGAIAAHIRDEYGEDEDLVLGMVEGETDAGETLDAIIDLNAEDAAHISALKEVESDTKERRARLEARVKARRDAMAAIMEAVDVSKWERARATLSLRKVAPKRVVVDEDELPDAFWRVVAKPDMAAIKAAEDTPPGCALDNGGTSLTVRTK